MDGLPCQTLEPDGDREIKTSMATTEDVAQAAGVSTATVSRVLSGYRHVTSKTRERVMEAVSRLGYEPNANAKSLRTTRTRKIIVTVPNIANIFFSNIILGVEAAAAAAGYTVLLGDVSLSGESEANYASMLRRKEADGLIFLGHSLPQVACDLIALEGLNAPIVNGCEFNETLGVSSVHIDNGSAARQVMDYLYGLGHKHIGVVTGAMESPISRDRLVGCQSSARANGALDDLIVMRGDFTVEAGEAQTYLLLDLDPLPTAIFCFSDDMAIGALHAIRQRGLSCPKDVSIVGFDDIRTARYAFPPLTTVRQPMAEIGRQAVGLLIEILEGRAASLRSITLAHELIPRESTGAPRS